MRLRAPPVLIVLAASAIAGILGEFTRRLGLSIVMIELLLGIAMRSWGFIVRRLMKVVLRRQILASYSSQR